jgi:hypothetical protein
VSAGKIRGKILGVLWAAGKPMGLEELAKKREINDKRDHGEQDEEYYKDRSSYHHITSFSVYRRQLIVERGFAPSGPHLRDS